jgi:hypothetical protein
MRRGQRWVKGLVSRDKHVDGEAAPAADEAARAQT